MAKKKVIEVVEELSSEFLAAEGYELYNAEFVKEGRDWFLRVFIDYTDEKTDEDGNTLYIGTEDCEKVSRFLSEKLDEADPIEQNYYLEVSSPGMDRPLVKPEHYQRYIGEEVEIKLYRAINGTKNIEGILQSAEALEDDYEITVKDHDASEWTLKLSEIAKANLAVIL